MKRFLVVTITFVLKARWSSGATVGSSFTCWSRLIEINDLRGDRLAALGCLILWYRHRPYVWYEIAIASSKFPRTVQFLPRAKWLKTIAWEVVLKRGFDHVRYTRPALPRILPCPPRRNAETTSALGCQRRNPGSKLGCQRSCPPWWSGCQLGWRHRDEEAPTIR